MSWTWLHVAWSRLPVESVQRMYEQNGRYQASFEQGGSSYLSSLQRNFKAAAALHLAL